MARETPLTASPVLIGALGGMAAICVKYLGQDHGFVTQQLEVGNVAKIYSMGIGYAILAPILLFLGGLLAWVSGEVNRMKLLAIGVAAPALITTWAGGAVPDQIPQPAMDVPGRAGLLQEFLPITPALAQTGVTRQQPDVSVTQGVKLFFGIGKQEQRYWVIVGSYDTETEAARKAAIINAEAPEMKAFVGKRRPDNVYYPVLVGDYLPLAEANELMLRATALESVKEAYLSVYADRQP